MVDRASVRNDEAAAQPVQRRAPDIDAVIAALVRLLARQAAREHLAWQPNPDAEEIPDER